MPRGRLVTFVRLVAPLVVGIGLVTLALQPSWERRRARAASAERLAPPIEGGRSLVGVPTFRQLRMLPTPELASWSAIGGCGAGGGSASGPGGNIQWIGRNVTGGLVDAQVLTSFTTADANQFTAIASRLRTALGPHLGLALNVPVLHKAGQVSVLGTTKDANIAGFGDVSLELAGKLGRIGQHQFMLTTSLPTGASDAVRQGVILPQHLQLGSGGVGVTGQYQHTRDQDWGLIVAGVTTSWNGPENRLGDFRAPSATAYGHAGYLLGALVPAVGLTLFGKLSHDRERGADRPAAEDPRLVVVPSLSCEWANDWIALLPAATFGVSAQGWESLSVGIGIASSLF